MIHRLLLVSLGRRPEDDRDHYANKRLDLGGPLLAGLFRLLFRKLQKDVRYYVQRCVDRGKDINIPYAINKDTITKGLRYSLATGNWGAQGTQGLRAGVSQVCDLLPTFPPFPPSSLPGSQVYSCCWSSYFPKLLCLCLQTPCLLHTITCRLLYRCSTQFIAAHCVTTIKLMMQCRLV